MHKLISIVHMEYKIQIKRFATWGFFFAVTFIALLDNFPSSANMARLEFLTQPSYFIYRIVSLSSLLLFFGLLFLSSNRFSLDQKTGMKSLFMSAPLGKGQYVWGKLLGTFFYIFTLFVLFLLLNTLIYIVFVPTEASMVDYAIPLVKSVVVIGLSASLFVSFCSVALPVLMDIRLFYLLASALFILDATMVGSAKSMPFYLIVSGDLVKLIWQHPDFPFSDAGSIVANLLFLLTCGFLASLLLLCKRGFWRTE